MAEELDKEKKIEEVPLEWKKMAEEVGAFHLFGSKIAKEGFFREMPTFSEQKNDETRTEVLTFQKSKMAEYSRTSRENEVYELTEHEALIELSDFLEGASRDFFVSRELQNDARALNESLNYIGVKEFEEATKGLSDYYKKYLDENVDGHLVLSLMSDTNSHSERKSDVFVLDNILKHFSDEDLEKYSGRIHRHIEEVNAPASKVKYVVLDDWSISGEQMRYVDYYHNYENKQSYKPEINLLIAKKNQIENGFNYYSNNVGDGIERFEVKSYFVAKEDERFSVTDGHMGHVRVTGFYSSVDYGFEDRISRMIMNRGRVDYMPPLTNIIRPYREEGYVPENIRRVFGGMDGED